MTTWTADSLPPCPECGGPLERIVGNYFATYRCVTFCLGSWDRELNDPMTVANASWTRDLWAEVARLRAAVADNHEAIDYYGNVAERAEAERSDARNALLCATAERDQLAVELQSVRKQLGVAEQACLKAEDRAVLAEQERDQLRAALAEVEAERDALRRWREEIVKLTAQAPGLTWECTASSEFSVEDVPAILAVLVGLVDDAEDYRPVCGMVIRERAVGTVTARSLCPLPPGHEGDHAEALAGDDTDTDRSAACLPTTAG